MNLYRRICSLTAAGNSQTTESRSLRGKLELGGCLLMLFLVVSPSARAANEVVPEQAFRLVKERCRLRHYLDRTDFKFGPGLKDLFKRETLANGKPVDDQTVSEWISEGSTNMPAFKYTLSPRQIQLIVIYLKGGFSNLPKQDRTSPQPSGQ